MQVSTNQVAQCTLSAKIIRANGTIEDLGVIDQYKMPLWRRSWLALKKRFKELSNG